MKEIFYGIFDLVKKTIFHTLHLHGCYIEVSTSWFKKTACDVYV